MHVSTATKNSRAVNATSKPINQKALPTPIRVPRLASWLHVVGYESLKSLKDLIDGFSVGFPLHYEGPCENSFSNNHISVSKLSAEVEKKSKNRAIKGTY